LKACITIEASENNAFRKSLVAKVSAKTANHDLKALKMLIKSARRDSASHPSINRKITASLTNQIERRPLLPTKQVKNSIKLGIIGLHNHYHIYPMADYLAKGISGLKLISVFDRKGRDWYSSVAIKMGRQLRCFSVTYQSRYAPSSRLAAGPFSSQPSGLHVFWQAVLSLIGQRPQRVFSLFASHILPKYAAAMLYRSRKWCTSDPYGA
jgi:hypothetical protein